LNEIKMGRSAERLIFIMNKFFEKTGWDNWDKRA
jgi:hypothetical protein